jgi:gluconate 2-dehydrogenase gamma chain
MSPADEGRELPVADDRVGGPGDAERRDFLKLMAAAPLAAFAVTVADVERAAERARGALASLNDGPQGFTPAFFTPHEWRTSRVLADLVIPRDARSGSATEAGVPEFMDFMLHEHESMQRWMRDGLAWLDGESQRRSGRDFVSASPKERAAILDDIAWPQKAPPALKDGATFFSHFRDLTASGFWSSRMGVRDLRYIGNTAVAEWKGCPPAALQKLGVHYGRR